MTRAERAAIEAAVSSGVSLVWATDRDDQFVRLQTGPCPLLADDGSCSVYDVRPYNCRRFVCLREKDEPWRETPQGACANVEDRLATSYQAVAFYKTQQRYAQDWAAAHGWTRAMA